MMAGIPALVGHQISQTDTNKRTMKVKFKKTQTQHLLLTCTIPALLPGRAASVTGEGEDFTPLC